MHIIKYETYTNNLVKTPVLLAERLPVHAKAHKANAVSVYQQFQAPP